MTQARLNVETDRQINAGFVNVVGEVINSWIIPACQNWKLFFFLLKYTKIHETQPLKRAPGPGLILGARVSFKPVRMRETKAASWWQRMTALFAPANQGQTASRQQTINRHETSFDTLSLKKLWPTNTQQQRLVSCKMRLFCPVGLICSL